MIPPLVQGKPAGGSSQDPSEIASQVIDDISQLSGALGYKMIVAKTKGAEKRELQRQLQKLQEIGVPQAELDALTSIAQCFDYVLEGTKGINQIRKDLENELKHAIKNKEDLDILYKNKKEADAERKNVENSFADGLQQEITNLFSAFEAYDGATRETAASIYKNMLQNNLQELSEKVQDPNLPQKNRYAVEDQILGLKVKFTDIDFALLFYEKLSKIKEQQLGEFAKRYEEVRLECDRLRDNLIREKGASETFFDNELSQEKLLHTKAVMERKSFEDECRTLPQEKLVERYGPPMEDYFLMADAIKKMEKVRPELKKINSIRAKISYLTNDFGKTEKLLSNNHELMASNIKEVNSARARAQEAENLVADLEQKILNHSSQVLASFKSLAVFLKGKGIDYDFGYEKVNGKKPIEYFKVIESEQDKVNQVVMLLINERAATAPKLKDMEKHQEVLNNAAQTLEFMKRRLDELQSPEEKKQRNELGMKANDIQNIFMTYIRGFSVEGQYEGLNKPLDPAVPFEKLVSEHYLGILKDATDLVKKQAVSLDAEAGYQRLKKELNLKPSFETAQKILMGLKYSVEHVGEEFLNTKNSKTALKKIYSRVPQHENLSQLKEIITKHSQALESLASSSDMYFTALAKIGPVLGVKIESASDLIPALQSEKEKYAKLMGSYKKYQELKQKTSSSAAI